MKPVTNVIGLMKGLTIAAIIITAAILISAIWYTQTHLPKSTPVNTPTPTASPLPSPTSTTGKTTLPATVIANVTTSSNTNISNGDLLIKWCSH